ncbi:MAG: hypothetical protein ACXABG_17120 [Promethearchaeota archaeon]|jgi:UDP-N-acetylglucosamine 2-epimerase
MKDNTMKKHYILVTGTRPQIIKTAPLLKEALKEKSINISHIFTGQHYTSNLSKDIMFIQLCKNLFLF